MLAGTSASSLRVQITRLAWLLHEQAAGQEVAGGEPPLAATVMATPPPPAPRGGEKSQSRSRAPWGQDILPGGSGGHREPRAHAILTAHAPPGRWGAVREREERLSEGGPQDPEGACKKGRTQGGCEEDWGAPALISPPEASVPMLQKGQWRPRPSACPQSRGH